MFRTLTTRLKRPTLRLAMKQRRALHNSSAIKDSPARKIYETLVATPETAPPVVCNFTNQVLEKQDRNQLAIRCLDQDTNKQDDITYGHVVEQSRKVATFFNQQGFKKGNSVALMLGQRPEWWYSFAGLMKAGIAAVPCPRLLTPKDLHYRITDLKIQGVIVSLDGEARINAVRADCPSLKTFLTTGDGNANWTSFKNISSRGNDLSFSHPDTTTADPCVYLYTSGTTGNPKAVIHHHDYPFFHWPTGERWLQATPDDLVYNASDTGWGFTVWITTAVWSTGAQLLITPTNKKFSAEKMLATLRDQPVTIFCAAPTVLRLLVADPSFDRYEFPKLKKIVTVGEALDETVITRFAERGVETAVSFGQAETPLLIGRVDNQPHLPGTMGQPITPYKIEILDDNLEPLPPGHTGQIAVDVINGKRGGLMRGYANAPEKTHNAFSNGYYLTGDWAERRNDGYFVYQGRRDDLIKGLGYRIGPDEIEKAGMSHPAVAKIAVIGIRTERTSFGRTIKAFVLLKPGYKESPALIASIQRHIKGETAPYKYPRFIECLTQSEWEKLETTSGKIRRAALREHEEHKLTEGAHIADIPVTNTPPMPRLG